MLLHHGNVGLEGRSDFRIAILYGNEMRAECAQCAEPPDQNSIPNAEKYYENREYGKSRFDSCFLKSVHQNVNDFF